MEILEVLDTIITNLLNLLGTWGALLGCIFILFESIIPILPLSVFITLNFMTFGNIVGFFISWLFTIMGCMMSYYIFKRGVSDSRLSKLKESKTFGKIVKVVENMNFSSLALLIAIPFTPAFAVNIAAGICRVDSKKYLYYYRDNNMNEIDLIIINDGKLNRIECKSGFKFNNSAVKGFKQLDKTSYNIGAKVIICNTDVVYPLEDGVYVLPLAGI